MFNEMKALIKFIENIVPCHHDRLNHFFVCDFYSFCNVNNAH